MFEALEKESSGVLNKRFQESQSASEQETDGGH